MTASFTDVGKITSLSCKDKIIDVKGADGHILEDDGLAAVQ